MDRGLALRRDGKDDGDSGAECRALAPIFGLGWKVRDSIY